MPDAAPPAVNTAMNAPAPALPLAWPSLAAPYDAALRQAVADLLAWQEPAGQDSTGQNLVTPRVLDPVGILAAGSILRGQGGPTSDIDLYVIHPAPFRMRLQRRYEEVPFEIFVNPPHQVRRYFTEETAARRPITAHMLATGFVLLNCDPVVDELRAEAAAVLASTPPVDATGQTLRAYLAVDQLDNARDLLAARPHGGDPVAVDLTLWRVVDAVIEWRLTAAGGWLPRTKETVAAWRTLDPAGAALLDQAHAAPDPAARLTIIAALARHTFGADTFFTWDGAPGNV